MKRELPDEAATTALGQYLAPLLTPGMVVWLNGDLGAGKTTLVRALLRTLGHIGPVKSPTYTLVEVYVVSRIYWYHFDFYRFSDPEEFLDAGLDEYFRNDAVCLVEWPDKAAGFVPPADLVLCLRFPAKDSFTGRVVELLAYSERGRQCLNILANHFSQGVA
ncbi:bifunctional alanine racemase/tRNA (adenosine(37)-N6)-threonylcarbamoyltransferase complex ATPase subunit type 1 TsaE [Betaproteobacteria bacterium]|nr:bifunctional alanine racemase/tRNA (adenosine(37)-N6)-threonylcarbamoyltransferase complex ATPase subunit type 1 TsaE [Betaproteobacteria bacterium]